MHCCCDGDPATPARLQPGGGSSPVLTDGRRRIAGGITAALEWAAPITMLALMPKCPACVAGYVLLFTGIGLSFPAAATLRWMLIAFNIVALAYLVVLRTLRHHRS